MSGQKVCVKCSLEKPATTEFFYLSRGYLVGECKDCAKARSAQRRSEKHEEILEWKKRYREERGELHRASMRKSYQKHAERRKLGARIYREKNILKVRVEQQARYRKNPEPQRARARAYAARKHSAKGRHTAEDVQKQLELQGGRCFYCRDVLVLDTGDKRKFHVDHYIPLVRGGSNGPENIVCACQPCNNSKHAKLPDSFIQELSQRQ